MRNTFLAILFLLINPAWAATPTAMVTDLQGAVSVAGEPVTLLMELNAGAAIHMPAESRLKLVMYPNGKEFTLQGEALALLTETGIQVNGQPLSGEALLLSAEGAKLSSSQLSQAAILMRSTPQNDKPIRLVFPVATRILEPRPVFSWRILGESEKAYSYRLEILSEQGKSLFVGRSDIGRFRLPKGIELPKSERLTWELEARRGEEMIFSSADFSIASDAQVARVDDLSAQLNNDFGRRIMFARYLEANGFQHDADNYWRTLAKEYPDLDVLQAKLR
jgi:hypothetical protein